MTCPKCQTELQPHWKRCPACGAPAAAPAKCTGCGATLQQGWRVCPECEAPVGPPAPPAKGIDNAEGVMKAEGDIVGGGKHVGDVKTAGGAVVGGGIVVQVGSHAPAVYAELEYERSIERVLQSGGSLDAARAGLEQDRNRLGLSGLRAREIEKACRDAVAGDAASAPATSRVASSPSEKVTRPEAASTRARPTQRDPAAPAQPERDAIETYFEGAQAAARLGQKDLALAELAKLLELAPAHVGARDLARQLAGGGPVPPPATARASQTNWPPRPSFISGQRLRTSCDCVLATAPSSMFAARQQIMRLAGLNGAATNAVLSGPFPKLIRGNMPEKEARDLADRIRESGGELHLLDPGAPGPRHLVATDVMDLESPKPLLTLKQIMTFKRLGVPQDEFLAMFERRTRLRACKRLRIQIEAYADGRYEAREVS